ncbi:hypothetical protein Acr_03g0012080 [Actinidia rufa]|uniref:Uncharacterized protein n=1 Tax=Actinidia rufa TaxID=165716 RepID=A0A7J0ED66_9ERIC|nr:hypothetical protein Acr_03g0012080 [Actinidia rufa]
MEVLSIQQHARDTLSRLRMRKRDKNWARDHMRARLKGGLGGTGELGMGCRWAVSARLGCTGRSRGCAEAGWWFAQAGAAQRCGWWLDGGCAGRGCTEAVWRLGGGGCLEAGGGCRGCTEAAQEAGLELSGCAGLHRGLVAVWWLRSDCPRLRRRLKVVAVGFRVWAAVEAD